MNKEMLRQWADDLGLDLIGVAPISRYENVAPQWNPLSILPTAKSVIAYAREIPRGQFLGIEEGTFWISIARQTHPWYAYDLCRRFEDQGILAVPCSPLAPQRWKQMLHTLAPDLIDHDAVLGFGNVSGAGGFAQTHMVIQAGPGIGTAFGNDEFAGADGIDGFDALQGFGGVTFAPDNKFGAGIGGPHQSPSGRENNPCSIYINYLILGLEMLQDLAYQGKFLLVGAGNPDFGGGVIPGHVF